MASIRHVFVSPLADVADPTLVRPSNWNDVHAITMIESVSIGGNVAGVPAAITQGNVFLAGGNNVTLSQNGQSITISAGAGGAGAFTAGMSDVGNTSGTTGVVGSQIVFAGGNNVTLSQSVNGQSATITISAFNQSLQTQSRFNLTLSGNTSGVMAQVSSGVLTLAGGNNVTLSQAGNAITISAFTQTEQSQSRFNLTLSGNTSGVMTQVSSGVLTLAGGNNITLSQAGNAITISAFTQTLQTQSRFNLTLSGNTSGALADVSSGVLTLAGGNNITLSQAGNAITISAFTQTLQSQNRFNLTLTGNTAGVMAEISSGTLTLAGGNNITLSQAGNVVTISAAAQTVESQSIGMSNLGNTSGTTGIASGGQVRFLFAGGNNVTLSQSINGASGTITISAFNQTVQTQNLFNLTITGNTSGALAGVSSGTLSLAGGNNITLSQAGNAITISAFNQTEQTQNRFNLTLGGNTSGALADVSSGTLTLAGGANITLSQAGNAVTIVGAAGAGGGTVSQYTPFTGSPGVNQYGQSSYMFYAMPVQGNMSFSRVDMFGSVSVSSSTNSSHGGTLSIEFGIYTRNVSTLSLASSGSVSYAWTNTSDNSMASLTGVRAYSVPVNIVMTPGDYWVGFITKTATANANWITLSNRVFSQANANVLGLLAGTTTNSSAYMLGDALKYSVQSANIKASVAFSELRSGNPEHMRPHLVFANFTA